jgi:hypothetical protein
MEMKESLRIKAGIFFKKVKNRSKLEESINLVGAFYIT